MPKKSAPKSKATSKKRGTITEIRKDWDDPKKVRVSVELPKKKGKSFAPEESVVVEKAFARKLAIGDKLDIATSTTTTKK